MAVHECERPTGATRPCRINAIESIPSSNRLAAELLVECLESTIEFFPPRLQPCLNNPQRKENTNMSHHYSGPDFGFPHGNVLLDFTDLYAFPKPGDAGKSIL